jgi:hypothetical protein
MIGRKFVNRWYQLSYQFGVLISRSSLHLVKIRQEKNTTHCCCKKVKP